MKSIHFNRLTLARPMSDFNALLFQKRSKNKFGEDKIFFPKGRDALMAGLDFIGLKAGDNIIIPAFMCESTIAPLRDFGYKLAFLDVDRNLNFDISQLSDLAKNCNARAILAVHYFGFPCNITEIYKLCLSLDIKLIEDRSHSFLSLENDIKIREKSDIIIYSLRKNLPIRDGGCLKLSKNLKVSKKIYINQHPRTYLMDFIYLLSRIVELIVSRLGWPNIYSERVETLKNYVRLKFSFSESSRKYEERKIKSPSVLLSKYLSNSVYLKKTQDLLIRNYTYITSSASEMGLQIQHLYLPENTVPQWAVLRDGTGKLVEEFRRNGVGACRWPGAELIPEVSQLDDKFPNTKLFNRELSLIPIHQSLGDKDISNIISIMREFVKKNPRLRDNSS